MDKYNMRFSYFHILRVFIPLSGDLAQEIYDYLAVRAQPDNVIYKSCYLAAVNNYHHPCESFGNGYSLPLSQIWGSENEQGSRSLDASENNNNKGIQEKIPFIATRGYDSVVWSRLYSQETLGTDRRNFQICGILAATLDLINAKGMVVGHTPQTTGANCKCNSRIWRIDVGMSSGVLGAVPEVLEIIDDQVRVIRASTDKMLREETVDYYSI